MMSQQVSRRQPKNDMNDFWRKLQPAVINLGGSLDDLSLISRRESKACFNLLAGHVLAMAKVLCSSVRVEQRFDSIQAVVAAARFTEQGIIQQWARERKSAGAISVAAEVCLHTPPAAVDDRALTLLEHNGFRVATLMELVTWCKLMIETPLAQPVAALGDQFRGRNGCLFVPCAKIMDGVVAHWWDHYSTVCRTPYTLLVACRE